MSEAPAPFLTFLRQGSAAGGFGTDDVLAALLPLLEQVAAAHAEGLIAPLDGLDALHVHDTRLGLDPARFATPRKNTARIAALQQPVATAVEVVGESRRTTEVDAGSLEQHDLRIANAGAEITRPVYLPGYVSWEHRCGHHDPLTDVFSAGLLLASLACDLDFTDPDDLGLFVSHRPNLFALRSTLHPVVAATILQMTELHRHRRPPSLEAVVARLRDYREQSVAGTLDFTRLRGFRERPATERGQLILSHLRNRLFEISRRNRLIHFKPTLQTLNLTLASVPLLLDHRNIKVTQLFLWHAALAKTLSAGEAVVLGNYVRFEDAPYAAGVLDQIIASERRDRHEFGFSQLRLVLCFLRWHNLKETPQERIHSPLLLLPVELTRKKGVRDAYVLKPLSTEAEVNPALRHHLRQLYGLNLPERIDLGATTLDAFHALLAEQIRASEPGVTLDQIDRPQIELIHDRARQRLAQFHRRQRAAPRAGRRPETFDHCYDRERFRPLGLQLFLARVKPARSPLADVAGQAPAPRQPHIVEPAPEAGGDGPGSAAPPGTAGVSEKEQHLYSVREPRGSGNPYQWDFDLCSQTLGNFNYRKMSLVQDYAALAEQTPGARAFEEIFSLQPRPHETAAPDAPPLEARFPVVECDPTQTLAVARAQQGRSYIIQGPPGTGKSQTITNLVADYVARGRRVLFVCEKRAAIDVVFHRLSRQGLDELCCLIHDSQTDKRDFIRNLKQTYETFLHTPLDDTLEARRADCVRSMDTELAALRRWTEALEARVAGCSLGVRALLARLLELQPAPVELDPVAFESVPAYPLWTPHAEVVRALSAGLRRTPRGGAFAQHAFRHLSARALTAPQPLATITAAVTEAERLLAEITQAVAALDGAVPVPTLADLESLVRCAARIAPLAAADALDLLNPRGTRTRRTIKAVRDWRAAERSLDQTRAATAAWKDKLPPADTTAALAQAKALEGAALRWLSPAFWRLRGVLRTRYDFSSHAVAPAWSQLLAELDAEHTASAACAAASQAAADALGDLDFDTGVTLVETLTGPSPAKASAAASARAHATPDTELWPTPAARALQGYLQENPEATLLVENLAALQPTLARLPDTLGLVRADFAQSPINALAAELQALRADLAWLPDLLPILADVLRLPAELQAALRQLPLSDEQLEAAMARKSLAGVYQQDRTFEATDGRVLARRIARLQTRHGDWLALNARWIHQRVRREFLRKVQLSNQSATQLTPDEKELKRLYATGRRELEHEFSKTMRHRSIRDLADGETGVVLRDLKPVWLMSPLSVSDTLPLSVDAFDVVIFDEASQILVEEAIPAVFRAPQVIVVGDEMQLPPTNFFSATRSDEEPLTEGAEPASAVEELDADSFLTQAARNLSSTLLGWHYRSRSEALISYSNHAFYEGKLLTVPDRALSPAGRPELVVQTPGEGSVHVDALLARSVSFHVQTGAVYEQRRNTREADYIAHLVRGLLARNTGQSLGIVAFSEAQQGEIEGALTRLAADDATFRNQLETEYEREADGQFCGLFVKNLENVQGDERDIILLSVCYGHDRNGRMLMNFGPINQRGGEKRLNVIFSRARRHMAVVSSIRHFHITNDYNDGAACLRDFLEYAAACSTGDTATARRVLAAANLGPGGPARTSVPRGGGPGAAAGDPLAAQLAQALRARGFLVETDVGQSTFRLPLALRREGDATHTLGVLTDDSGHFAQRDLLERFLLRPGVLRAFGWKTLLVFAKDWYHDREAVLRQIEQAFAEQAADVSPAAEAEAAGVVPAARDPAVPAVIAGSAAPVSTAPLRPAPPAPATPAAPEVAPLRHFTCTEEGAAKFWESRVEGGTLTVRFGRLGTQGQTQTKTFATPDAARREQEKLMRSKVAKGYGETPPSR